MPGFSFVQSANGKPIEAGAPHFGETPMSLQLRYATNGGQPYTTKDLRSSPSPLPHQRQ
jgi:hypothetical protein